MPPSVGWIAILLIVSAVYTANVLQWSLRFGRLAMDPVFDDVGYLIDGLQRLNVLDTAGFHGFCDSFVQAPPHSPWSTSVALTAFALMGVHDWAPYILNGFLVFFLLLIAWDLVDVKNSLARAAILSAVLLLQLPFQAVLEFRPDFAVALFTASFSILLVKMGCYDGEKPAGFRNHFWVGLLAGLAYLTKPTFFPHTTIMLFAAMFLADMTRRLVSRDQIQLSGTIRRLLVTVAGALLVAGPYFIRSWRSILDYFLTNTGSGKQAGMWKIPGGFGASLSDRLFGYSTDLVLGRFAGVLMVWLLLSLGFAFAQRNRQVVLFMLSGLVLTATSLLVIAAGEMGDPHFSYTWEILFVLTTLFGVAEIVKTNRTSFLGIVFCAMALFTFYKAAPTRNVWTLFQDTTRGQSLNELIVRQIGARVAAEFGGRPPIVYATFVGKVNTASQSWLALTESLNLKFLGLNGSGDINEHLAAIQAADVVEVADPSSQWLDRWLPSTSLQSVLLEKLRNSADFRELPPVVGKEGAVFLFERKQ